MKKLGSKLEDVPSPGDCGIEFFFLTFQGLKLLLIAVRNLHEPGSQEGMDNRGQENDRSDRVKGIGFNPTDQFLKQARSLFIVILFEGFRKIELRMIRIRNFDSRSRIQVAPK